MGGANESATNWSHHRRNRTRVIQDVSFSSNLRTAKIYEGVKEVLEKVLLKHFWAYRDYVTQKVIEDLNRDRKENLERKQEKTLSLIGEKADMKKNQDWVAGLVKPQKDNDK